MTVDEEFPSRYGPWAVVAGASEGVGAEMAWALASRGLDLVLIARRRDVLEELADTIARDTGVEARALAIDLAATDATAQVAAATAELDVGFVFYNAGADPHYAPFLSQPIDHAVSMVERNCITPLRICHHFGAPMQ